MNDQQLDKQLRELYGGAEATLPDNGFTNSVVRALPERGSNHSSGLLVFFCTALGAAMAVAIIVSDLSGLQRAFSAVICGWDFSSASPPAVLLVLIAAIVVRKLRTYLGPR
jgi:hypothetical protein